VESVNCITKYRDVEITMSVAACLQTLKGVAIKIIDAFEHVQVHEVLVCVYFYKFLKEHFVFT